MQSTKGKRVACLYRVSTKGQISEFELQNNDIPMQRQVCREFIDSQPDWKLTKEYSELGVSGFKKYAKDRDELQQAMKDAENGEYDVLLVFMFDRLGRKDDETPFIVEWFDKQGIEVWSTQEGRQSFKDHVDKLLNYIRFWQSSGESRKTSMRVDVKHKQMVRDGIYRGGSAPYGYRLIPSGTLNKRGKELLKLEVDPYESKVVEEIFELIYKKGYGSNRIATHLNKKEIRSKNGNSWSSSTINYILKNPIYKGYMTYGRNKSNEDNSISRTSQEDWIMSEKPIEELAIIPEAIWDKIQNIRKSRSFNTNDGTGGNQTTKSPLVFVGKIFCGDCKSPLTTTYDYKKWTLVDGTVKQIKRPKYRCSGKALSKKKCNGKTTHSYKKLESDLFVIIDIFLDQLRYFNFEKYIGEVKDKILKDSKSLIKQLEKKEKEHSGELVVLKQEITKSILGKSSFKPDLLGTLIEEKEKELSRISSELKKIKTQLDNTAKDTENLLELQSNINTWKIELHSASVEEQKMMLDMIIEKIHVMPPDENGAVEYEVDFAISPDAVLRYIEDKGECNQVKSERKLLESTTTILTASYRSERRREKEENKNLYDINITWGSSSVG